MIVDDGDSPFCKKRQHFRARGYDQIAADQRIGFPGNETHRAELAGVLHNPDVRGHLAALLGEANLVHHRDAAAVEMRRHAEDRPDGDDTRSADASDQQIGGARKIDVRHRRDGRLCVAGGGLFWNAALDGDEARAKSLDAGRVLIATGLVDLPLAAELRLERHDRDTVRLSAAIAATLAHRRVDHDASAGIGQLTAFAAAALFRGTDLIVDQDRDAFCLPQRALHGFKAITPIDRRTCRHDLAAMTPGLLRDDANLAYTLGGKLARDLGNAETAFGGLAAGHGDRIVIKNLVGDGDAGRDRGANGEQPRMRVGAVAQIDEDMPGRGERRLPDPAGAFAAHLGERRGVPVHPLRHVVTADTGERTAAFGHHGGAVMRTARTEIRQPFGERRFGVQRHAAERGDARRQPVAKSKPDQPFADNLRQMIRGEGGTRRQQRLALLVDLAG